MQNLHAGRLIIAALFLVSAWNASFALRQNIHWPAFANDEWTRLDRDLTHAKDVLSGLPDPHIEYRTEEATETYDAAAYYQLQNILAPSILQRSPVEDRYVLVEFWSTRIVRAVPELLFVEDLGHGFGLYRRP